MLSFNLCVDSQSYISFPGFTTRILYAFISLYALHVRSSHIPSLVRGTTLLYRDFFPEFCYFLPLQQIIFSPSCYFLPFHQANLFTASLLPAFSTDNFSTSCYILPLHQTILPASCYFLPLHQTIHLQPRYFPPLHQTNFLAPCYFLLIHQPTFSNLFLLPPYSLLCSSLLLHTPSSLNNTFPVTCFFPPSLLKPNIIHNITN